MEIKICEMIFSTIMGSNTLLKPSYMCLFPGGGYKAEEQITMCHCRYHLDGELLQHQGDASGGVLGETPAGLPPCGQRGGGGAGLHGGQPGVNLVGGLSVIRLGAAPVHEGEGARGHSEGGQQDTDDVQDRLHCGGDLDAKKVEVGCITCYSNVGNVPYGSKKKNRHSLVLEEINNSPAHLSESHDDHNKTGGLLLSLAHALGVEAYMYSTISLISCLCAKSQLRYRKQLAERKNDKNQPQTGPRQV